MQIPGKFILYVHAQLVTDLLYYRQAQAVMLAVLRFFIKTPE